VQFHFSPLVRYIEGITAGLAVSAVELNIFVPLYHVTFCCIASEASQEQTNGCSLELFIGLIEGFEIKLNDKTILENSISILKINAISINLFFLIGFFPLGL
jgi:hypothetical protein